MQRLNVYWLVRYRTSDYWTLYAPGSFYFHALLMKVFGSHVLVGSIAASVITAMAVSSCYLLVSGWLQRPGPALACAALFFAANFAKGYYLSLARLSQLNP
jgi:uncharacterized membrane protein